MKRSGLVIILSLVFFIIELSTLLVFHRQIGTAIAHIIDTGEAPRRAEGWRWGMSAANNVRRSNLDSRNTRVFLQGGSTGMKFFAHNEVIHQIPGLSVYDLTAPRQSIFERLMLIELIDRSATPGLVVMTIHPISLSYDSRASVVKARYFQGEHYRYGIESSRAEYFYQTHHPDSSPPLKWRLMYSANLILSLARQIIIEHVVIKRSTFFGLIADNSPGQKELGGDGQKAQALREQIKYRLRTYSEDNLSLGMELLNTLADACLEKNLRLAIVELPIGETYRAVAGAAVDDFHRRMEKFAAEHDNVGYYSIPVSLYGWRESLFEDSVHTTPEGSRFFSCPFLRLLLNRILPDANIRSPLMDLPAGSQMGNNISCAEPTALPE